MTNYQVSEGSGKSPESELETNKDIEVGDTIELLTNNQMGYRKCEVVLDDKGKKTLKTIDDYDMQEARLYQEEDDSQSAVVGKKRKMSSPASRNYEVNEGSGKTPHSLLKTKPEIQVGDTIEMVTNNQMGYEKYKVVLDKKGKKDLKLIRDYDNWMDEKDYDSSGGKKHKRKTQKKHKRKTVKKGKKTRRAI